MRKSTADNLTHLFYKYLSDLQLSDRSKANYLSDLSNFSGWFSGKLIAWGVSPESLGEIVPFINSDTGREYKTFLTTKGSLPKTVNRRLSTLRSFSDFLIGSQLLDFNFMADVVNIVGLKESPRHVLLDKFERELVAQKASKNTIKNYLSDIRHFLSWLERQETVSRI